MNAHPSSHRVSHIGLVLLLAAISLIGLVDPHNVASAADERCFEETGQCISGRFRQYWEQNGGLAVFGYPVTAARNESNRDTGKVYLTQWFERNRFELHTEHQPPYDVLLGRLGDDQLRRKGVDWRALPREQGPIPGDCLWFPQTGHNVCNEIEGLQFKRYWQEHGLQDPALDANGRSLALFGLPLTEARMETNSSGYHVMTQWFERARFEWHPDRPTRPLRRTVLLGLLGVEVRTPLEAARPGDLARTRSALQAFFAALRDGRYAEAIELYGGSYKTLRIMNPDVAPDDFVELWRRSCEGRIACLRIKRIVGEQTTGPREFRFVLEFMNEDGTLFEWGPGPSTPQTQFPYIVTRIGDQFLVQDMPVVIP